MLIECCVKQNTINRVFVNIVKNEILKKYVETIFSVLVKEEIIVNLIM